MNITAPLFLTLSKGPPPVLKINDHATGGRRTKDILGGPKGWGPKKKVANAEIYVIFEVFAFCGGRTKTDFKDRVPMCQNPNLSAHTGTDFSVGGDTALNEITEICDRYEVLKYGEFE